MSHVVLLLNENGKPLSAMIAGSGFPFVVMSVTLTGRCGARWQCGGG